MKGGTLRVRADMWGQRPLPGGTALGVQDECFEGLCLLPSRQHTWPVLELTRNQEPQTLARGPPGVC